MKFRKREAPNYSLARNHKLLNNFVKRVLESRKDVFLSQHKDSIRGWMIGEYLQIINRMTKPGRLKMFKKLC